jgi:hypothetical protein
MANGDAAAAAGLAVFASTQDIRQGYDNDNIRGDELAQHLTAGTHPASAIVSGTLNTARIPNLDAGKITTGTFSTARIPNLNADKITAGTITRPVSTSGNVSCTSVNVSGAAAAISSTGNAYFNDGVTSPHIYNNAVSGLAVYVASNGVLGKGASTKRLKKDIKTATINRDAVLALRIVNYRMKNAPEDSPLEIGVIAEELDELGLTQFVWYDEKGRPGAVHYERLALALVPIIQDHETRLNAIEERLA